MFNYIRDTGREVPSAVAIISKTPYVEDNVLEPEETVSIPVEPEKDEETIMPETKPSNPAEMVPVDGWTDPELQPQEHIIVQRIAALMSVKSIITIALTVAFMMLVLEGKELPDQFVSIYTMCISFFFGYQFKKAEGGGS